ncbi:MAG: 50S ribosomal protein L35 [bacterium]|nr:50S ribosomal protein L35 [bacterium]
MALKTNKSVLKRIKITGRKKMLHRPVGQDKYRAKKSGRAILKRRGKIGVAAPDAKVFKKYLPYNL